MTYGDETAATSCRTSIDVETPSFLQQLGDCVANVFVMSDHYTCVLLQLVSPPQKSLTEDQYDSFKI
jgi:hypothetical protein